MKTSEFTVKDEGTNLIGYQAYDEKLDAKRPAVIVFHAFEGRNALACEYADRFAKLGYVGCAVDMYGDKQVAKDLDGCLEMMMPLFQDRAKLRKRLAVTFDAVKTLEQVDANKIAAIGFCFGGLCALDLARIGADLKGAVPIHGVWAAPEGLPNEKIHAKVLALHGYDDPQVKPDQLAPFVKEMDAADVDWQVHYFSQTKHAFTDPDAEKIGPPNMGRVYNPLATQRSWEMMVNFMQEVFA